LQIAFIIAASGGSADSPDFIKSVVLGSARTFIVQSSLGSPGRYTLTFDDANELAVFTPRVPASQGPEVVSAIEYIPYDAIESIGIFPPVVTAQEA
jgi:hypothetical protein